MDEYESIIKFAMTMSKKRVRASTILGEPFRPHAYIPLTISLEKIKEALKEIGYEGELPEPPEDMDAIRGMAMLPLDFSSKKESLNTLGHLLATSDITSVIIVCDTTAKSEGGDPTDVLCVASVNLKSHDDMVLLPYQKAGEDDVAFGEEMTSRTTEGTIRDSIIEGFLITEANKYLHDHPEADTDAYVDSIPTLFPNVNGGLNQ